MSENADCCKNKLADRRIGGFRIIEKIHCDGQGMLFKAVCETPPFKGIEPGAVVALKAMPVVHDEGGRQWTQLQARMNALAKLSHPNVVKYYGCFREQDSNVDFLVAVMEFLDGETLKDCLARNPHGLDVDEALRIAKRAIFVCTSEAGIIHRGINPGNIFLCKDGGVKLIDIDETYVIDWSNETDNTAGNICGAFDYMAPEFANPDFHGDVKSDVFSIGVVLHEMLTGEKPYKREECADRQANDAFLSRWANIANGGENPISVSSRVNRLLAHADEVLLRALDPDREKRYADFADFYKGLKGVKFRELKNGGNTYRLLGFIGRGGFSEVFKARWMETRRLVAIKHLPKPEYAVRFKAEFWKLRGDTHFVQLRDFIEVPAGRGVFLVIDYQPGMPMDYLPGMPGSSILLLDDVPELGDLMTEDGPEKVSVSLSNLLSANPDNVYAKMLYGAYSLLLGREDDFKRVFDEIKEPAKGNHVLASDITTSEARRKYCQAYEKMYAAPAER